jgi:hypothetical protein
MRRRRGRIERFLLIHLLTYRGVVDAGGVDQWNRAYPVPDGVARPRRIWNLFTKHDIISLIAHTIRNQ